MTTLPANCNLSPMLLAPESTHIPFEQTIARPDCTFELAIENIDIGGPTMIRAAAKNHESVAVIVDPTDYDRVLAEINEKGEV